jgi:dipeptidyl aminopeptidase/acylaminoacyl peptidase
MNWGRFFGVLAGTLLLGAPVGSRAAQPAGAAPAPAAPARSLPVEALAALPNLSSPVRSPDGWRIAAQVTVEGQSRIAVWDLRHREAPPRMLAHENYSLLWLRWAGPNRILIGVGMTALYSGLTLPVTRIIAMDVSGGNTWSVRMLQTGRGFVADTVIHVDPEGRYLLASSQPSTDQYPAVYRADLATGESEVVQRPQTGVWSWFADARGVVRLGIDYGERRIRFYYRNTAGEPLRRIDTRRYPQDDSTIDTVRFIGTDRSIVVTDAVTGRFAVYNYDFATDTRGEAIFEHPTADVSSVLVADDGSVQGVSYEDERPRIHWVNPDYRRVQATLDRALPGKLNLVIDSSADEQRLLVWSSAADDPGTYYVFDRAARRLEPFMSPYGGLIDNSFAPVRPISFRGRDASEIHGYLTLPPGREPRGLPLVLMPHGGPFARDSWTFDPWVQFLASRGYAVLQVNFRGSTGYGRAWVERGYGQLGTGMIDDLEDGVDWAVREGFVDARRVCVFGASYGGYVALWAPIRHPERYRCAASFAGISDLSAMVRYDARRFTATRYARERRRQLRGGAENDLGAVSPLRQIGRISVPLLVAHGERDTTVPTAQSRSLVRALAGRNILESVFYPEAGHGFSRPQDSVDFLRRLEAFLARHNPATPPPVPAGAARPGTAPD